MKTPFFQQPWRSLLRASAWAWAVAGASLMVTAARATTVTTITGGPSASNPNYFGYVDGVSSKDSQFHTPIGLSLDTSGNNLFVADRDNNAIRELNLSGDYTTTFTTFLI